MTLGEKIRTIRNSRNMTQEQLAQEAGISLGAIKKYESNDRKPKSDQLQKIANAFQISVNVFIENEVNTISDLISLIMVINEQIGMNFESEKDDNGNIIPSTIKLAFSDNAINQTLAAYINAYNSKSDKDSYDKVCQTLLDDNRNIKRDLTEKSDKGNASSTFPQDFTNVLLECSPRKQDLIIKIAKDIRDADL